MTGQRMRPQRRYPLPSTAALCPDALCATTCLDQAVHSLDAPQDTVIPSSVPIKPRYADDRCLEVDGVVGHGARRLILAGPVVDDGGTLAGEADARI